MHVVLLHKGCTCMQGPLVMYAVGFAPVACVVSPVEVCELWILQAPLLHPNSRPGCQTCFRAFPCHNQRPRVLRRLVLWLQLVHLSPGIAPSGKHPSRFLHYFCHHQDTLVVGLSCCYSYGRIYSAITPAPCSRSMPHGEVLGNPSSSTVAALMRRAYIIVLYMLRVNGHLATVPSFSSCRAMHVLVINYYKSICNVPRYLLSPGPLFAISFKARSLCLVRLASVR